jgi:tetratricopeptide (TPR) repeat protein
VKKSPDSFREGLFAGLRVVASPGRSSRFDAFRHGVLHGPGLLAEAARAAAAGDAVLGARLLRLAGKEGDALAAFSSLLKADPACAAAWAGRWELKLSRGTRDDGIRRAVELEPRRAAWRAWRGLRLLRRDARRARVDLEKAAGDAGPAGVLARVGLHAYAARGGRAARGTDALDRAIRSAPREGWLRRLRALARLRAGDVEGFVADFEAQNLLDESIGTLTKVLDREGPYDPLRFLARTERALKTHGRVYWLLALRGDLRRSPEIGDLAGSLRDCEEAVGLAPRPGWVLAHLARARQSVGDARGALEAAAAAVAAEPECGWIRVWLGEVRRKYGDNAGAMRDADAGLALDGDYEIGYACRGAARRALGRNAEALADLEKATALAPRMQWAVRQRELARAAVLEPKASSRR